MICYQLIIALTRMGRVGLFFQINNVVVSTKLMGPQYIFMTLEAIKQLCHALLFLYLHVWKLAIPLDNSFLFLQP